MADGLVTYVVRASRAFGPLAWELVLSRLDGPVPPVEPGAHLEIELPSGLRRTYSVCGREDGRRGLRLVRLRSDRPGSAFAEIAALAPGTSIKGTEPRSDLPLRPPGSAITVICGGIGATPMLSVADRTVREGGRVDWHYFVSGQSGLYLIDEIREACGPDEPDIFVGGRRAGAEDRLRAIVDGLAKDAVVYCCGPVGMMRAVSERMIERGMAGRLHMESFDVANGPPEIAAGDKPFRIRVDGFGGWHEVAVGQSILTVLRAAGHTVPSNCRQGNCGTCLVWVKSGVPDHRDRFLTDAMRRSNGVILTCVSRSQTPELVLAL